MSLGNVEIIEKGVKIVFFNDDYNPRTEQDNLTKMVCFHKRYDLGDEHEYNQNDYDSWEELKESIEENEDVLLIKPLYLYDHSGLTVSTKPFSCPWDSGQIGWVYITQEQADLMGTSKEDFERILLNEVEEYDKFLRGEVYGYIITENGEEVDSCGGFIGSNPHTNGMLDEIDEKYHKYFEGYDYISVSDFT